MQVSVQEKNALNACQITEDSQERHKTETEANEKEKVQSEYRE